MLRPCEHLLCRSQLDDAARLHHGDARGQLCDHRQTVRDQHQRQREFALEPREQFENLRADGNIERRDRLVRNHQLGTQDQRARDPDALALPAGKFVRVAIERLGTESDHGENFRGAGAALESFGS